MAGERPQAALPPPPEGDEQSGRATFARERHRSSAWPLAAVMAGLIVYASLYPFSDWSLPPIAISPALLKLPTPRFSDAFDRVSNLLGYLPLGLLLYGAIVRSGFSRWAAAAAGLLAPAALSYGLELTQYLLPQRVPSMPDWLLNSAGAAAGVALAAAVQSLGLVDRWAAARDRWLVRRSGAALALLLLWPFGLLFPAPLPFGLGPPWDRLLDGLQSLTEDVPWLAPLHESIALRMPVLEVHPASEWFAATLGLLAPIVIAFTVARPGWRRGVLAAGAVTIGFAANTLSAALNFGPSHALAWITPVVVPAAVAALLMSLLLVAAPARMTDAFALVVLSALIALVVQAPADAYFAQSLQDWEQGRFIRFHGLAQWVGWLWPVVAIVWLLVRIGAPLRPREAGPADDAGP
jgi:VanZ family protein